MTYSINVRKVRVDKDEAYRSRERFSQEPSDTFMGDGGETHQVSGLGFRRPDIMQEWEIKYSDGKTGRYGTIERVQYAKRKDGSYERLIVDISQVGRVDVVHENDKLKNGPVWTVMDLPIAATALRNSVPKADLEKIMGEISPTASALMKRVAQYQA